MVDASMIKKIKLFHDLSSEALTHFAQIADVERRHRGDQLFEEGKPADKLYCILHGRVALQLDVPNKHRITIYTAREGSSIGWSVFVEPHEYTVSARCVEETEFLVFKGNDVWKLFNKDQATGFLVMQGIAKTVSRRFKDTSLQLVSMMHT